MYSLAAKRVFPVLAGGVLVWAALTVRPVTAAGASPWRASPDAGSGATQGEGAMGAAGLWDQFVLFLRTGQYERAYACFSPRSRAVFSYKQFVNHYNPLTAAYQATMAPVDDGQLRVAGDVAQLRFAAPAPLRHKGGVLVTALMVRESAGWFLVAAAREASARTEAEARNVLRRLWQSRLVREAVGRGEALSASQLRAAPPLRTGDGALSLHDYGYALESRAQGLRLVARARERSLRSFTIAADGQVRELAHVTHPGIAALVGQGDGPRSNQVRDLPAPPPDRGDPASAVPPLRLPEIDSTSQPPPPPPPPATEPQPTPAPEPAEPRVPSPLADFSMPDLPPPEAEPAPKPIKRPRKMTIALPPLPPDRGAPADAAQTVPALPRPEPAVKAAEPQTEETEPAPGVPVEPAVPDGLPPVPPPQRGDPATEASQPAEHATPEPLPVVPEADLPPPPPDRGDPAAGAGVSPLGGEEGEKGAQP